MSFIYSFVAKQAVVLADYTDYSGNFSTVAIQCLQKCPAVGESEPEVKLTFTADRHTFNYLVTFKYVYMVVADDALGRSLPYAYLERVKTEFQTKYAEKAESAIAHSLDKTFGPRLKQSMEYVVAHPDEFNKVALVQRKVEEVKTVMVDNIEKVLERGDKIDLLVEKTENMQTQANKFHKVGRQLRDKMFWANMRAKMFFFMVAGGVVGALVLLYCINGGACFG